MKKFFLIYFLIINLVGFFLFAVDKYKARHHLWRVPERVLFFIALLGGTPGSLAAMYLFRHKTRHRKFVIGLPLILILQILGFSFLTGCSSEKKLLQSEVEMYLSDTKKNLSSEKSVSDLLKQASLPVNDQEISFYCSYFRHLQFQIGSPKITDNQAIVPVTFTHPDNSQLATIFMEGMIRSALHQQASSENTSLNPANLLENSFQNETIALDTTTVDFILTKDKNTWTLSADSDEIWDFLSGLTENLQNSRLLSPEKTVSVFLDTLSDFSTEEWISFFQLNDLASDELLRILVERLQNDFSYQITDSQIQSDTAEVTVSLTSSDFLPSIEDFKKQAEKYTSSVQALEDGETGRADNLSNLLFQILSSDSSTKEQTLVIPLLNDGYGWTIQNPDQLFVSMIADLSEIQKVTTRK